MSIPSGHLGNLDKKQQAALDTFRHNVSDILKPDHDDHYLLRWLRARQFDTKKSETMLRTHMKWRTRMGADTILQDPDAKKPVLVKYFSGGFIGAGKNGSPIFLNPYGDVDVAGINRSVKKFELTRYEAFMGETMMQLTRDQTLKTGRPIETFITIMDLDNYGLKNMSKAALDYQISMLQLFEDNYPETMGMAFVINVPSIFPLVFKIFSPFLSEDTKNKVRILGRDFHEELFKFVDRDQLPEYYGGTRNDPPGDAKCTALISYGGQVPCEYFRDIDINERNNWTKAVIKPRSTLQLDYNITIPGSILRWQFSTDDKDVGFGVYRRTSQRRQSVTDMTAVIETTRANCHLVPEDGHLVCDTVDTYVLRFDNTYSWKTAKKLYYSIDLLEPNHEIREFPPENSRKTTENPQGKISTELSDSDFEMVQNKSSSSSDEFVMMPENDDNNHVN